MQIPSLLTQRFADAISRCPFALQIDDIGRYADMIRPAGNPEHGDYQANCAMPIGKLLPQSNPRSVAQSLIDQLKLDDLCDLPEIAGPGF
ncbi:MAG: arginine--tRNA ligase, partial [Planctomycetales bacterium]|nr:arginine--tRNA ligase [Planctomycetales bacterium]